MSNRTISIAAALLWLTACGSDGGSEQEAEQLAFVNLADVHILENKTGTTSLQLNNDFSGSFEVTPDDNLELKLNIEQGKLEVTAPEVSQDERIYVSVQAIIENSNVAAEGNFYVYIENDTSRLIADGYEGLAPGPDVQAETPTWRAEQFGINYDLVMPYELGYNICYPTPDDPDACDTPESIYPDTTNYAVGDFTGNGHQDLIIAVHKTPHTAPRGEEHDSYLLFFENDTNGNLHLNNDIIEGYDDLNRYSMYRLEAADLNGDGIDDLVVSGGYRVTDEQDEDTGDFIIEPEPIVLLLSENGRLTDASNRLDIEMREGRNFSQRAISLGDINGNGHKDIFISFAVVHNNGDGTFTESSEPYFTDDRRWGGEPYSSEAGDFTGDGRDNLIVLNATPLDDASPHSFVLIHSSDQRGLTLQDDPIKLPLPDYYWGDNGRVNDSAMGKLLDDYAGEQIVVAETRTEPYYNGRILRLYAYENGNVIDLTDRIIGNDVRTNEENYASGEGMVRLLDFNNNGLLDIVDTTAGGKGCVSNESCIKGVSVFLNDGEGYFHYDPMNDLPTITTQELEGYEFHDSGVDFFEAFPINLGHAEGYELMTRVATLPQEALNEGDDAKVIYYMLRRKKDGLK